MDNIIFRLLELEKAIPDKAALIEDYRAFPFFKKKSRSVTFGTIAEEVKTAAHLLLEKGFEKGDRILIFVPVSYELYKVMLAVFYIGATAVFVDAWADKERMAKAIETTEPAGFIGTFKAQLLRVISPAVRELPIHMIFPFPFRRGVKPFKGSSPVTTSPDDSALITFTTGSTGIPKAAKRTHRFLWNQYNAHRTHLKKMSDDIDFATLPIFILNNMAEGITTVIADINPAKPAVFSPEKIVRQIVKHNVTSATASTIFFEKMAEYLLKKETVLKIDSALLGGSPVYPNMAEKILRAIPFAKISVIYGSTEAEPISIVEAEEVASSDIQNGLYVGNGVDSLSIRVIKPVDAPISLKDGEVLDDYSVKPGDIGEIIVAGDYVLTEYLNSPQHFKRNKIVDGDIIWHRTGDAGRVSENGDIFLFGRVSNRITLENETIYTLPIERKMFEIEGVKCAAVLRVRDEIVVVLEAKDNLHSTILKKIEHIKLDISNYVVEFMDIPRDQRHSAKVDYGKLKSLFV